MQICAQLGPQHAPCLARRPRAPGSVLAVVNSAPHLSRRSLAPFTPCPTGLTALCSSRARPQVRAMAKSAADEDSDSEDAAPRRKSNSDMPCIGIVGFGVFGQFLAKRMVNAGHRVLATSRSNYDDVAKEIGVEFFSDANDFCEEHPEVVLIVTSILSLDSVLSALPLLRLKRRTLVVDVLSVKVFPKQLLLQKLPPDFDIVCTHPMFGPDSGKDSWKGLNFQYEKVRIGKEPGRMQRVDNFLKFFENEGCNMVEMTCEDHDYASASCQFVTHTVGRMLGMMNLHSTPINTKGFEALLSLVEQTNSDSFELYYGLFLYNQNATDELERLENGLEKVKKSLFSKLHDIAREEMFPEGMLAKPDHHPQIKS